MTLVDALAEVRDAGGTLSLDGLGVVLRARVSADAVKVLRERRDQLVALLQLRELHQMMGFDEADVVMIENAIVGGEVHTVKIVPEPSADEGSASIRGSGIGRVPSERRGGMGRSKRGTPKEPRGVRPIADQPEQESK
jgi:hypothetical protein